MKLRNARDNDNSYLQTTRCKLDNKVGVVGLDPCLVRRLVSYDLSALVASVYDYITALRIGECSYGAEYSAAFVCSITGVDIHVQRAKAERTMVSRGIAKGQYLLAAILADKACIVFCKSFSFHHDLTFRHRTFRIYLRPPHRKRSFRQARRLFRVPSRYPRTQDPG